MNRRLILKSLILAGALPFSSLQAAILLKKTGQVKLVRTFDSLNQSFSHDDFSKFISSIFDTVECVKAHQSLIDSGDITSFKRQNHAQQVSFHIHFKNELSYLKYQKEISKLITDKKALVNSQYKIKNTVEYI